MDKSNRKKRPRHGGCNTPEYATWESMISRCENPNRPEYPNYGGRGISVCEQWLSFSQFRADMGARPSLEFSIDRIDVNGNYEPGNCRWATKQEQNCNRRDCHFITHQGRTLTVAEWARETGLAEQLIRHRVNLLGWDTDRALTEPKNRSPAESRVATHCKRGHCFAESGYTNPTTGERYCKVCVAASQARYAARQKLAKAKAPQ